MSKWRHGCDAEMFVYIPKGYSYKEIKVRCGSTAFDGGVNQCDRCEAKFAAPAPLEDESDMDYYERTSAMEDRDDF